MRKDEGVNVQGRRGKGESDRVGAREGDGGASRERKGAVDIYDWRPM